MTTNAYVLAADPAWLTESVSSYYHLVDRIVVSYDQDFRSWTGTPLDVEPCLGALAALDVDDKLTLAPGHYARTGRHPADNDTYQRQCALDEASKGADWVLQLDTDEVLADDRVFLSCVDEADRRGFDAMDFPARNLYKQIGTNRFLEHCTRFWRTAAGFPGPVAIRAGSILRHCRQSATSRFRVDFRATNTDPWQSHRSPVHRVIGVDEGIYHFSWVRTDEYMERKSRWSGHADDYDWRPRIARWRQSGRHPTLAAARTPFEGSSGVRLRISKIEPPCRRMR